MKINTTAATRKKILGACAGLAACAMIPAATVHAQDILVNSGFEADNATLTPNSNNIGAVPTGWTVTGGTSNLDTGSGTIIPYDGPFSGGSDGSTGGTTIFDGTASTQPNGGVTLSQTFTLATTSNLGGSFAIGDRDGTGASAYALFSITGVSNGFSYSFSANAPNYNAWSVYNFDAGVLPAGDYTVSFDLPNTDNLDAIAFGVSVPEPSSVTALIGGAGLLGLLLQRGRRTRRA